MARKILKEVNSWLSEDGMKTHITVDAKTKLTRRFTTTIANLNQVSDFMVKSYLFFADAGYRRLKKNNNKPAIFFR